MVLRNRALPETVGGQAPNVRISFIQGVFFFPLGKGVRMNTVTYSELFQLLSFLVAFAGLIYKISKKK